jgi:glucokinase
LWIETFHASKDTFVFIGIDLGGTKILGVRADEHGQIAAEVRRPTDATRGLNAVLDRIVETIRELMPPEGVAAVGVGVPGPMDPVKGVVYDPPNLPGWGTVPLRRMLEERLQLPESTPIVLANDANAAALAEYKFGAGCEKRLGKPIKHLVYLTISTGIGGGVIADGKLLLGATGMAAELGHIVIDLHGPRCSCGTIGCLEAMASGTALAKEAAMIIAARRETSMADAVGGDPEKVTAEIVVRAAKAGDRVACELMDREGMLVGVGVVNCIHSFNPELVVLGGGVTNAGDLLFKPVKATVEARIMRGYRGTFDIVPAALGNEVGGLGAVAVAMEAMRL